jgi:hypothetical protein
MNNNTVNSSQSIGIFFMSGFASRFGGHRAL